MGPLMISTLASIFVCLLRYLLEISVFFTRGNGSRATFYRSLGALDLSFIYIRLPAGIDFEVNSGHTVK